MKKTLKNDIKNEILEEVKDSITEEIHNHMNKLKDGNKEVRHRSMQSTFIFWGVPGNEQSDAWETSHSILCHCYQVELI